MYKVVHNDGKRCLSVSASVVMNDFVLEYKPNEWAEAKVGGLLVFKNLDDAEYFVGSDWSCEIWRCEVSEEVELPKAGLDVMHMSLHPEHVPLLWDGVINGLWRWRSWPTGTKAFKRVKITERVS